jgi:hypothetical protein
VGAKRVQTKLIEDNIEKFLANKRLDQMYVEQRERASPRASTIALQSLKRRASTQRLQSGPYSSPVPLKFE